MGIDVEGVKRKVKFLFSEYSSSLNNSKYNCNNCNNEQDVYDPSGAIANKSNDPGND